MTVSTFDRAGVAISALCVIHCLLLPLVTSLLPVLGLIAENEMIHKGLVLLAIGPAALAFLGPFRSRYSLAIRGLGFFGLSALLAGAFVEPLHDFETTLTVIGGISLASAHIFRGILNRPHIHQN